MDVHVNVRSFFCTTNSSDEIKAKPQINGAKSMNYSKTYLAGAIRI